MKLHRIGPWLLAAVAVVALGLLPTLAVGQDTVTSSTTITTTTTDTTTFNQPTAVPMGQGWYASASSVDQTAWMSRGMPWSNDLMQVRGVARAAAVDADMRAPGVTTASETASSGADRLVTGIAQWMVASDNSLWEVRFTRLSQDAPFGGAGVMRVMHGETGIGASQFPRSLAYLTVHGPVDVFRNGQRIATGLPGHIMATQGIRLPDTGRLLDTANVREQEIQLHLVVQGVIPGAQMESLYVFWPNATLDLRNLANPVALLPAEIETARSFFVPGSAVAGFRGELGDVSRLLLVSLRDRFLARSNEMMPAGEVIFQITNDSQVPRGFFIEGPGVQQRTPLIQPGETTTLRANLQPGSYRIASFFVETPEMHNYMHWDTITIR